MTLLNPYKIAFDQLMRDGRDLILTHPNNKDGEVIFEFLQCVYRAQERARIIESGAKNLVDPVVSRIYCDAAGQREKHELVRELLQTLKELLPAVLLLFRYLPVEVGQSDEKVVDTGRNVINASRPSIADCFTEIMDQCEDILLKLRAETGGTTDV